MFVSVCVFIHISVNKYICVYVRRTIIYMTLSACIDIPVTTPIGSPALDACMYRDHCDHCDHCDTGAVVPFFFVVTVGVGLTVCVVVLPFVAVAFVAVVFVVVIFVAVLCVCVV